MKIAYLILTHSDPDFFRIQCDCLSRDSDIYVHVNKKSELGVFKDAVKDIKNKKNIYFVNNRVKVNWGGFSIVEATMRLLAMALNNKNYDRYVLLTGQDYPIKNSEYIHEFFESDLDSNYLFCNLINASERRMVNYKQCRDLIILSKLVDKAIHFTPWLPFIHRKITYMLEGNEYKIYGITPKWAITAECAKYIYHFYQNNKGFNNWFKMSHAPDDFYVSTIVMNSRFNTKVNNTIDLFYVKWLPNNQGAKVLDEYDFEELKNSNALFAKKFTSTKSCKLIRMIDND